MHGGLFSRDDVKLDEIRKIDRFRQPSDEGTYIIATEWLGDCVVILKVTSCGHLTHCASPSGFDHYLFGNKDAMSACTLMSILCSPSTFMCDMIGNCISTISDMPWLVTYTVFLYKNILVLTCSVKWYTSILLHGMAIVGVG